MNTPNKLTILLLIAIACSCSKNQDSERQTIDLAEHLMNERPDSALYLLENSVRVDELSHENYALWCLLVTQARDKTCATDASEATIRIAIDYYSKHSDSRRLSLAFYEAGRIAHEGGRARDAQKYYHQALDAGQNGNDYKLLGRIASHLGDMYLFQELYREALYYLRQSENYSRQTADTANLALELRDIGRAYNALNQNDSSIVYYKEALTYASPEDSSHIMNELGGVYAATGQLDTALLYAKQALNYSLEEDEKKHIFLVLGEIYMKTNVRDSAKYYFKKIIESNSPRTAAGAYYYLYRIAKAERQWDEYAVFQEKYEEIADSIQKQTHTETELRIEKLYNYDKMANEATLYKLYHVKNQRNFWALAVLLLVLLFSLVITFARFRARGKKRKREILEKANQINQFKFEISQTQVNENLKRIEEIDIRLGQADSDALYMEKIMLEAQNNWITSFITTRDKRMSALQQTPIYIKLHASDTKRLIAADYAELERAVGEHFPNFYSYMDNLNLSPENKQTATLIKAMFSQSDITRLLGGSTSKSATRIKKLMEKLNMEDKLFKFIRNL